MTSRHSSAGGRRGVAPWIVVTAVAVLVIAAGTTAYLLILRGDDDAASASCSSQVVLPVVSAPGAAAAITDAVTAFDATNPVARSACVSTAVTTLPNPETVADLAAGWQQGTAAPGMWVADSAASLAALEATNSALTAGRDTKPMAASPVVLAVAAADAATVTAAGPSWQTLPAQAGPNGSVILPSGQHLVLALPDPTTNRATSYALQSVVAARSGGTVDAAAVGAAAADLAALSGVAAAAGETAPPAAPATVANESAAAPTSPAAGQPAGTQPATTQEALTQLAAGTGSFTAVPVVESDLVAFSATTSGLRGISLTGGTVGDAVYAVPLTASWINPTMEDAAAAFLAYLRGPGGDKAFTENGFVVAEDAPTATTAASGADQPQSVVLPDAGQDIAVALAAAIGAAPAG